MAFIDAVSNQTVTAQLQNTNRIRTHIIDASFPTPLSRLITSAAAEGAALSRLRAKRRRKVPDGPPRKRSPTLAGNKRGANRKSANHQQQNNTKAETKLQKVERRFLWVTSGSQNNLTAAADAISVAYEAVRLSAALEYRVPSLIAPQVALGYTTRKCAEDCFLFRVGSPKRLARDVHEIILAPVREHSRKPDEIFERIERYCAGPRVELFARQARPDWDCWGEEVGKFPAVAS